MDTFLIYTYRYTQTRSLLKFLYVPILRGCPQIVDPNIHLYFHLPYNSDMFSDNVTDFLFGFRMVSTLRESTKLLSFPLDSYSSKTHRN